VQSAAKRATAAAAAMTPPASSAPVNRAAVPASRHGVPRLSSADRRPSGGSAQYSRSGPRLMVRGQVPSPEVAGGPGDAPPLCLIKVRPGGQASHGPSTSFLLGPRPTAWVARGRYRGKAPLPAGLRDASRSAAAVRSRRRQNTYRVTSRQDLHWLTNIAMNL
jgi:hypothetical protein